MIFIKQIDSFVGKHTNLFCVWDDTPYFYGVVDNLCGFQICFFFPPKIY